MVASNLAQNLANDCSKLSVSASNYVSLLGSNLVALWHPSQGISTSGANVTQWADCVAARALTPAGGGTAPQYAVDGQYFGGKRAIQFSANQKYLESATAEIIAAGARPFVFWAYRWRDATGDYPYGWMLNGSQDMVHFTSGTGGNQLIQYRQPGIQYADAGAHNTTQHYGAAWLDGTLGHYMQDGTDHTVAATGSIAPAIDKIYLGGNNNFGNMTMYMFGICTSVPSASQLLTLRSLLQADIF